MYDIIVGRDETDKKVFGSKGLIFLGKGFVKMGQYTSLSNRILMDIIRSHVILVAGKRGSGKSYSIGVIAEELTNLPDGVNQNITSLIFDTMGIFWTMKFENEKDKELLHEWQLEPKALKIKIFVPLEHYDSYIEKGIPADEKFALDITELTAEDWIITFGLSMINPVSILIERAISRLKKHGNFNIVNIITELESDKKSSQEIKNSAIALFEAVDTWGIFAREKEQVTRIKDLTQGGVTSILDLSVYNSVGAFNVRALAISIISRKIFNERMIARKSEEVESVSKRFEFLSGQRKKENPLVWMFIDEAHEFLPLNEKTAATDALIQLLREGRQPGISLVLATQQPGQIHRDVMTQSDIVIAHRVTSQPDIQALNYIMQSYVLESIKRQMDELPGLKGSAIILDDNSERIYPARIRPRFSWHGGESPTALKAEKRL
jgi:hypothetical protein